MISPVAALTLIRRSWLCVVFGGTPTWPLEYITQEQNLAPLKLVEDVVGTPRRVRLQIRTGKIVVFGAKIPV